jgi:serine/threonine-protein kinase CTR1
VNVIGGDDRLELGKELASGAFGSVCEARIGERAVALKRLDASSSSQSELSLFRALRRELFALQHGSTFEQIGVSLRPLGIVSELMSGGDLLAFIKARSEAGARPLDDAWVVCVASDVARALRHLHTRRPALLHRDVKSPNVLLTLHDERRVVAKLADFGTCRAAPQCRMRAVDQIRWLAPEVMRGDIYAASADVYGAGIVFSELLTLRRPYDERQHVWEYKLQDEILAGARPLLPESARDNDVARLARLCWNDAAEQRPSSSALASHLDRLRCK